MYVRELCVHYRRRQVTDWRQASQRLTTPSEAAQIFMAILRHEAVEVCGVLCLSTRHDVLAYHELSRGTVNATMVSPRDVFKVALLANATGVLVGHNHPSDDITASSDDLALTSRLKAAGDLIGVELLDHIIVANDRYLSFKESGYL